MIPTPEELSRWAQNFSPSPLELLLVSLPILVVVMFLGHFFGRDSRFRYLTLGFCLLIVEVINWIRRPKT